MKSWEEEENRLSQKIYHVFSDTDFFNLELKTAKEIKESQRARKKKIQDLCEEVKSYAKSYVAGSPEVKESIKNANTGVALYQLFIENIKCNHFLMVSFIFNFCSDHHQKKTRIEFASQANEKDASNTPAHYAVLYQSLETLLILMPEGPNGGYPRLHFTDKNSFGERAFDLSCRSKSIAFFNFLWYWRNVAKSTHNPLNGLGLQYACQSEYLHRVKMILNHNKATKENVAKLISTEGMQKFSQEVKTLLATNMFIPLKIEVQTVGGEQANSSADDGNMPSKKKLKITHLENSL